MLDWFKGLFSLEERRSSTLMFAFIVYCSIGIYMVKLHGDVPPNVQTVIITLGGLIAGVNSLPALSGIISASKGINQGYGMYGTGYNMYGSNYNSYPTTNITTTPVTNNSNTNQINGGV